MEIKYLNYIIRVKEATEFRVSFQVVEPVVVWNIEKNTKKKEENQILTCEIKWDSCSHFYFGEEDNQGYAHICGIDGYYQHIELLQFLHNKAFELMKREPLDGYVEIVESQNV